MKKWIQGLLVAALTLSLTVNSFAALAFSDVEANHWALSSIKTVSEKNITPGYSDASFRPLQKATKVEVIVASYRILKETGKLGTFSAAESVNRNKATLTAAGIPAILAPYNSDVYTAFSFALDKNIISKEELSTFTASGKLVEATKEQVATTLGKTLNLVKNQALTGKIIAFNFVDASTITTTAAPYINLLMDYKLIGNAGDINGNFNPKVSLGRDVTASLVAGVYNIIKNNISLGRR